VTWPILENDGRDLHVAYGAGFAATGYTVDGDQQCFLAVSGELISREEAAVQGTYGWLRPIRALARGRVNQTFIYPRTQADPTPEAVLRDFWVTEDGFRSPLGRVTGSFYVGRTSAGGTGTELGLTANGSPDLRFSRPCEFVARHSRGRITEVETNLATTAAINGQVWDTGIHRPKLLPPSVLLAG